MQGIRPRRTAVPIHRPRQSRARDRTDGRQRWYNPPRHEAGSGIWWDSNWAKAFPLLHTRGRWSPSPTAKHRPRAHPPQTARARRQDRPPSPCRGDRWPQARGRRTKRRSDPCRKWQHSHPAAAASHRTWCQCDETCGGYQSGTAGPRRTRSRGRRRHAPPKSGRPRAKTRGRKASAGPKRPKRERSEQYP